jgi:type IV secretory pathway VirB2 component (pilin)
MKKIKRNLLLSFTLCLPGLFSNMAMASSLKGTADGLGAEATKIGLALGIFALAVAGTYLALGKQDGGQKVTFAVTGILIVLLAPALVNTIRGITGGGGA